MTTKGKKPQISSFMAVVLAFLEGASRYSSAQSAYHRLMLGYRNVNDPRTEGGPSCSCYSSIEYESWLKFERVTRESYYVYSVSLFESFVEDVYKLLVSCYHEAVRDSIVAGHDIIFSSENIDVLRQRVLDSVAKDFSYKGIGEKLKFIVKTFKLEPLPHKSYDELAQVFGARNLIVHGQSMTSYSSGGGGEMCLVYAANEKVSELASVHSLQQGWAVMNAVSYHLIRSIYYKFFKGTNDPWIESLKNTLLVVTP